MFGSFMFRIFCESDSTRALYVKRTQDCCIDVRYSFACVYTWAWTVVVYAQTPSVDRAGSAGYFPPEICWTDFVKRGPARKPSIKVGGQDLRAAASRGGCWEEMLIETLRVASPSRIRTHVRINSVL